MKKNFFLVAAFIICIHAWSQQDSTTQTLDEIVLTASKYPRKQSETGKVITVLNQSLLEQMGSRNLAEILNTVAGVTINGANANLGTNQGVSIRGASFGNVLILVDGIPVNDPSLISNYYDINFIPIEQVERVEVLKGGHSTLYGSDAVAGVINIITRKKAGKPVQLNASVAGGSYETLRTAVGLNGQMKKWQYSLGHSQIYSEGFSTARDTAGDKNFDKDHYKQQVINGMAAFQVNNKLKIKWQGSYSTYNAGIDAAAFRDERDYEINNKNLQAGIGADWQQAKGKLHLNYLFNQVKRNYFNDSTYRSNPDFYFLDDHYAGRTHFIELYKQVTINQIELLAGIDLRMHNSDQAALFVYKDFFTGQPTSGTAALPDSVANSWQLSPYISAVYNVKKLVIETGGRWNYHNAYGNNFTYTINPSYLLGEKVKIYGNLSSAFKTPTHYQLFDPYAGNRELQPEHSTTIEAGFEVMPTTQTKFRSTFFNRVINNVIQYVIVDPVNYISQYKNVNRQQNSGLEAEIFHQKGKLTVNANYTYTTGKIETTYSESGSDLGTQRKYENLYRVPEHGVNLLLNYNVNNKLSLGSVFKYTGERYEPVYLSNPVLLDDYATLDLSAAYRLNTKVRFFADLKNITNTRYFDLLGYNNRRFNVMAGFNIQL